MRTSPLSVRSWLHTRSVVSLVAASTLLVGCSSQFGGSPAAPSSSGATAARPSASSVPNGQTTVTFQNFNASTLAVTVKTTTASSVGQPYIDQGKIHLQILVDADNKPVPCSAEGTAGVRWVRFDGQNGGIAVSGAMTTHDVDLDDLSSRQVENGSLKNVSCGDRVCIRAQYVTGGGSTKVDTHFSNPAEFHVACESGCTLTQGYWKTHGPNPTGNNRNEWPVTSLTLGTVTYTDGELQSIFETAPGGNGLISLAHQLIAAKLNVGNGADDAAIATTIAAADALIGSLVIPPVGTGFLHPSVTGGLTGALDAYNNGTTGPGHCGG